MGHDIRFLFRFAGDQKGKMSLAVLGTVFGELCGMLPYLTAAMLAGDVFNGTATVSRALGWSALAAVGILLKMALTTWASSRSHEIAFTILCNMRSALADKMRRVPMGVMLETPSGVYKNLIVDQVGRLEDAVAHFVPEIPSNVAAPTACILALFLLDWRMGLASLVTLPLCLPFVAGMLRGYHEKMTTYLKSGNTMNVALVEYVNGIQVIKAFGRTGSSFGNFSRAVNSFHDSTLDWWRQCWFWMAAVKAILPSTILGSLPLGAWLIMQDTLTIPVFVACLILPIGAIAPLMQLAGGGELLTVIRANIQPIEDFLATPELQRPQQEVRLDDSAFTFEHVGFAYEEGWEVLQDLSFTISADTTCAIVGPSGSGKSTIAKLMAGFWDVSSGVVRYGGRDIRDIPFDQLMGAISYVAQDNFLFDCSLRENIRIGKPDATDDEVEAAARAANCHDFIMQLPEGYDTLAGDAGDRLSGGERQRITIARAMLKPSQLIILDEATAFADPESEAQIQDAIGRLVKGQTLVVVAHRLSTIKNADQILVLDQGRLSACGTHEELLVSSPLYQQLWHQHIGATSDSKSVFSGATDSQNTQSAKEE